MFVSLSRLPLYLSVALFSSCNSSESVVRSSLPAASVTEVEPYDVEVLPYLPPGRLRSVAVFTLDSKSPFHWDDEQLLNDVKEKAASMGGNTVVATEDSPNRMRVFYIPEDHGSHGGDEEN